MIASDYFVSPGPACPEWVIFLPTQLQAGESQIEGFQWQKFVWFSLPRLSSSSAWTGGRASAGLTNPRSSSRRQPN